MERKISKEYSVVFLVESDKFKLRNFLRNFIFVVGSAAIRSAHRLSSQYFEAVKTPNTAELVPSCFSVHNHGFCDGPDTFSQKTPAS